MVSLLATIHSVPLCGRQGVNKCPLIPPYFLLGVEALFIMSRRTGRLAQACCCQPGCTCAELITVSFSADNIFNQEHRCCHFSAQTGVPVPDMHNETHVTGGRGPSGGTESPQVRDGGREKWKGAEASAEPELSCNSRVYSSSRDRFLASTPEKRTSLDGFSRFLSIPDRWLLRQDRPPDHVFPRLPAARARGQLPGAEMLPAPSTARGKLWRGRRWLARTSWSAIG